MLASFIKFIELQRTIRLFGQRSLADPFSTGNSDQNISSPFDLIDSFRPYLNKKDAEMLDTLIQLKEMMSFMEMMQPQAVRETILLILPTCSRHISRRSSRTVPYVQRPVFIRFAKSRAR